MRVIRINPAAKRSFFSNMSATSLIIIVSIIAFLIGTIILIANQNAIQYIAVSPKLFVENLYLWTPLTSMFMHADFFHLLVNMLSLLFIGGFIEKIIGRKRFTRFYLISGIAAALFFILISAILNYASFFLGTGYEAYGVGASGALFGIAGLLMILTPNLPLYVLFIPIPIKAKYAVPGLLIVIALLSFSFKLAVGNIVHLGGLLAGIIYGIYLKNKYKRKSQAISRYFS